MSTTGVERTGLTDAETRVLDAVDEEALVADLVRLVRVPSVTGSDAESDLQLDTVRRWASWGLDVDHWQLDLQDLAEHPDHPGTEAPRIEGWGAVGIPGPATEPALVLQGHVDVVPPGEPATWGTEGPWSGLVRGDGPGTLHGRGACDMKAGIAVNNAVARALVTSGVTLERSLALHSVVSEEDGGLGAFATMLRGHRGDAAVITEPTSGRIVVGNAGALTFTLTVAGLATHGSSRLVGYSALDAFLPVHQALRDLEAERNVRPDPLFAGNALPYPISIGRVRAGDWASSVPDRLVAEGRLGVQLDEDPDEARAALERTVTQACAGHAWLRDHPVEVTWSGGQFASGRIEADHAVVDQVRRAVTDTEHRLVDLGAAPYGSDLRLYAGMGGIPTLHYGPGDVRLAHGPLERVDLDEVFRVARSLAVLAVRRCVAPAGDRAVTPP